MKILYVVTQGEMGGAQRYVLDLAAGLNKTYFEPAVLLGEEKTELQKLLSDRKIPALPVPHLRRAIHPLQDLLARRELEGLFRKFAPDIIHLNSSKAGVIGSFAAHQAGLGNVVFTAHGFAFLEPHVWPIKQLYFSAEKLASRFRRKIITVSEYDRNAALAAGLAPAEKLITIHNGIDLAAPLMPRQEARANLAKLSRQELSPEMIVLGAIAHNYPTKDLGSLRRAAALLQKQFPQIRLIIIGRGSPVGEIPNASALLPAFDIFALSSRKEGFPYVILEAMRAGLPIVATAVGGIPEAIEDGKTGLLAPAQKPSALAQALTKLISDPQLAKTLGTAARARVKEFSLQQMLKATEQVYRTLIS